MSIETVDVQYVNQPKEGKKMGSIKTTDGRYFGVYPDKLHQFTAGMPITIEFDSNNVNGRTFHNVRRVVQPNGGGATQASAAPQAGGGNKSEEMFVMGFCNRFYDGAFGNGMTVDQVSAADVAVLIRKLRLAWSEGFEGDPRKADLGKKPEAVEAVQDDLNDDIPF